MVLAFARGLDKVRYPEKVFATLTMPAFLLLGCLRQLQSQDSLREQVQSLAHLNRAHQLPLARSTWSDALASKKRRHIIRESFPHLVDHARTVCRYGQSWQKKPNSD